MHAFAPWAVLWLASVPVLLWLWRISSTQRRVRVASLIPFERLARRAPTKRSRLVVNLLFWLQLAALLFLVAALMRPVVARPGAKTALVILDTSASLSAGNAFDQAKQAVASRILRKSPGEQWLIVATSPLTPLTPRPTSDGMALSQAVSRLRPAHLGGNLSTAAHIGRVLLGGEPDRILVVTDEQAPDVLSPEGSTTPVEWVTVGKTDPYASINPAIVGIDAQGPLCSPAESGLVATVQNFSSRAASVTVSAKQSGREVASQRVVMQAWERVAVALRLPEDARGLTTVSIDSPGDTLVLDNRAWLAVEAQPAWPVVVQSSSQEFMDTVGGWLKACPAVTWTAGTPPDQPGPYVLVTDSPEEVGKGEAAVLMFSPASATKPVTSYWMVSAHHPIGAYLSMVGVAGASLDLSAAPAPGMPVVQALVGGRQVPVVSADEREGRRTVTMRLAPTARQPSTAVLLTAFNSLRWLMGREQVASTGEAVLVPGFAPGAVTVRTPDGSTQSVSTRTGIAAFDDAVTAGIYEFRQGKVTRSVPVNFIDPLESNLSAGSQTWHPEDIFSPISSVRRPVQHPLANLAVLIVLLLLIAEAGWYWARTRMVSLTGRRRQAVIGLRLAAVAALSLSLVGWQRLTTVNLPRHVVYLVDRSTSIDAAQRAWIARRIASLEARRPSGMPRAVVGFGADAATAAGFGTAPLTDPAAVAGVLDAAAVRPEATNVESALLTVPGLPPPEHPVSVVLFSDGRETQGNATGALSVARRLGVSVFPEAPPVSAAVRTVWEELAVPPVVQLGAPVPLQLVLVNSGRRAKSAEIGVALNGVVVKRKRVSLRPGWQVVEVEVPAIGRGTMAMQVGVSIPEERFSEKRSAYTEVEGPPQLLMVTDQTQAMPLLGTALERRGMDVVPVRPEDLPKSLSDYDGVVLFNVAKSALSPEQVQTLKKYVEQLGGGLAMIGLGGDLAAEIQTTTPLDELLPVHLEPKGVKESNRRICIILLIDRSASMLGPRIAATKRAAVALVKQLSAEDLVGILAFDTQPYVITEVQQAGQVGPVLVDKLVRLKATGGTDIYPALTAAANRLELTGAALKHVILLSDGNTPFHQQAYEALIKSFKLDGITVSSIGIGAAFINTDFLTWLSQSTGGQFYQLRNLEELPALIIRDTEKQMGRLPFTEGQFRPTMPAGGEWFASVPEWPAVRGFLTSTAKPGAQVELTIDGGDGEEPLMARWTRGRGRVVSFLSDANTRWSPDWIRWPGFEGVWGQAMRWMMRPRLAEEVFVWVDERAGVPQVVVEGTLHDPKGQLVAPDDQRLIPLAMIQTGAWRWQASLDGVPSGWYQLALESAGGEAAVPVFTKRWVRIGTPPAGGEQTGQPPRESLLRQMARGTMGVYDMPDAALVPPVSRRTVSEPLLAWWLPLVILLLLVDVWLRGGTML